MSEQRVRVTIEGESTTDEHGFLVVNVGPEPITVDQNARNVTVEREPDGHEPGPLCTPHCQPGLADPLASLRKLADEESYAAFWWDRETGETETWAELEDEEREAVTENSYAETVAGYLRAALAMADEQVAALRAEVERHRANYNRAMQRAHEAEAEVERLRAAREYGKEDDQ